MPKLPLLFTFVVYQVHNELRKQNTQSQQNNHLELLLEYVWK